MTSRFGTNKGERPICARLAIAAAAIVLVAAMPIPAGAAQPSTLPRGASDISLTDEGARLINEAKDRFALIGFAGALKAIKDEAGITIAPADAQLVATTITLDNGKSATVLVPVTAPVPNVAAAAPAGEQALAAAPTWNFQINQCFARITDTWSYIDHCYTLYKMANDGDGTKDFFALQHYSTTGPNPPWVLDWAQIQAARLAGTPAQTWVDWSPKGDFNGNCQTFQLAVLVKAVVLPLNVERCDIWDMTKQNPTVDYRLKYLSDAQRNDRELSFEIAVSVAQGAWPQWTIPAESHGNII